MYFLKKLPMAWFFLQMVVDYKKEKLFLVIDPTTKEKKNLIKNYNIIP